MQADTYLVVGLIVGVLAIPALFSAFVQGTPPRAGAIMVLISGGLVALAVSQKPRGYTVEEVPKVFARVVARYID